MTRRLRLGLVAALAALSACGSPRALRLDERPADRVAPPTSSVHYRTYDGADGLAAALRWSPGFRPVLSAHRGGPRPGLPENALPSFEAALNFAPGLIEMDVRQAADGALVLMHDATLDRTTTGQGPVSALPLAALRALRLVDPGGTVTSFRIPTLAEALAWAEGRAVLALDVKPGVGFADVVAAVRAAGAADRVVVIVYSLDDHRTVARLAPDLVVSTPATTPAEVDALLASGLDLGRSVAFAGVGVPDAALVARLHAAGLAVQAATFGVPDEAASPDAYLPFFEAAVDILATDNVPAAAIAAQREALRRAQATRR